MVAPVARVAASVVGIIVIVTASVGAYYTIVGRIDRIDERMGAQGETLKTFATAVKVLAEKAATGDEVDARIERSCLMMQVANQQQGWVCPFVSVEAKPSPRKTTAKAPWASETTKQ